MAAALFSESGGRFVPAPESRAMWYEDALHGGPVAALFAREVERVPAPVPMQLARLTVELLRPIPTLPIGVATRVAREGRRIRALDAVMTVEDVEVARASALFIRETDFPVPAHPRRDGPIDVDGLAADVLEPRDEPWFHTRAVEMRFASGGFWHSGPADVWARLTIPVVAGEDPTPAQRVAAIADFGNGVSRVLSWDEYIYINPDLTIYLGRPPVDEWVCLRSRTDIEDQGIGLAQSELFDRRGAIGHALQSLYVDARTAFGDS